MSNKKPPKPKWKERRCKTPEKVKEVVENIKDKDLKASKERFFRNKNGKSRYADVVGIDKKTRKIKVIHQIGKQNKNGTPIKRERDAIEDMATHIKLDKKNPFDKVFHFVKVVATTNIL